MLKFIIIEEHERDTRQGRKTPRSEEKKRPAIVYVSGPITGHDDYILQFADAQERLEMAGYIVLNPADLPQGMSPEKYMPICMAMLEQADAVYMLQGWETSKGASVECLMAQYQGKQILYEE